MLNKIGVMQGRLSPASGDRLQFSPQDWTVEFELARKIGFDLIEWSLDREDFSRDPLWIAKGHKNDPNISRIKLMSSNSEVAIKTLCLDYFMAYPLIGEGPVKRGSINVFREFLFKAYILGVETIGLPLHEDVALRGHRDKADLRSILNSFRSLLDSLNLNIALEAEMPAGEFRDYVLSFENPRIGICYDTGNMVTMGYDLARDIVYLGDLIKEVHFKDRRVGSSQSVYLGTGDVDFEACCDAFCRINFSGPFILQAWREDDYLTDAKDQLEFVKSILKRRG